MNKYIITFFSHYEALQARRVNKEGRLISVPRALSSSWGTAMEMFIDEINPTFKYEAIYSEDGNNYKKVY